MKKITKFLIPSFLILMLIILVGVFGFIGIVKAQTNDPTIPSSPAPMDTTQTPLTGTIPTIPLNNYLPTTVPAGVWQNVAQQMACSDLIGLSKIICQTQQLLNSIVPVLIALAVVYFVWGVVQFMINDSEEAKTKGKNKIIYGIIGFAVIVGLWGLVDLVTNTFGLTGTAAPALAPLTGNAATCSLAGNPKIQDLLCYVTGIINNSIIPLLFALALVMFVWGVIKFFIINSDEEAKRAEGKQFMIWGIVALAVMLSVWGLVGILKTTFGINVGSSSSSLLPQVCPPGATNCSSQ
jgi:hypothetical protein